nr:MAG TPA: hypothetical protein [Caudoviricetes sp.]
MGTEVKEAPINEWKKHIHNADKVCEADGKLFIVRFDKIFDRKYLSKYNRFLIKKSSYEKQMEEITQYANFFIKFYDEENELGMAYLACKKAIDEDKIFTAENMDAMIDFIYDKMFTKTMIQKIEQMVEDNYTDDIEGDKDGKYSAKGAKYLESLEFTNEHIKIMLAISFGMKILSPVMYHYFSINVIKLDKSVFYIYNFYKRLFDIFGTRCNMYNKLFVYTKTKVLESKANNELIFNQREIMGYDEFSIIHKFVRKNIIEDNMVKFKFNENIIGFLKTIVKYQLLYFIREELKRTLTEVTYTKNADGLSGVDKLVMNLTKSDEGNTLIAELNAEMIIDEIRKSFDVPITDEEIEYYKKYHRPSKLQIRLVYNYYAKILGNCRDCKLTSREQYIIMMLVLKKKLLFDAGASKDDTNVISTTVLPYILSGNLEGDMVNRIIKNAKFDSTLEDSYLYQELIHVDYDLLEEIHPEDIKSIISKMVNSSFTYVCYERPDLLGKKILYSDHKISDELTFFIRSCCS